MAKGTLARVFSRASELATQQHATTLKHLDLMAQTDAPASGGGTLSRKNHLILLATDPSYQAQQLAKLQWMTPEERQKLGKDLEQIASLLPEPLPESVSTPPDHPFSTPPVPEGHP